MSYRKELVERLKAEFADMTEDEINAFFDRLNEPKRIKKPRSDSFPAIGSNVRISKIPTYGITRALVPCVGHIGRVVYDEMGYNDYIFVAFKTPFFTHDGARRCTTLRSLKLL